MTHNFRKKYVVASKTKIFTSTSPTTYSKLLNNGPQYVIADVMELYLYIFFFRRQYIQGATKQHSKYIKLHTATLVSL